MTPVSMKFLTTTGLPLALARVEVRLTRSVYDPANPGVIVPRLVKLTTDVNGAVTVSLFPCDARYHVTAYDSASDTTVHYHFYVPVMEDPTVVVRLQDLIVEDDVKLGNVPYDEASLLQILDAKANVLAVRDQVQGLVGQNVDAALAAAASETGAAVSATAAYNSEVAATQAAIFANAQVTNIAADAAAALAYRNASAISATDAAASATLSSAGATTSTTKASDAALSATTATTKAGEASTSAANASASEINSLASKNSATTSATNAATSETNSLASKNASGTSAANALISEGNALTSKTAANTSAVNAATSETNAGNSATAALGSKNASATSASLSQSWATQAVGEVVGGQGFSAKYHAVAAAASALASSTSAGNATTSEGNALAYKNTTLGYRADSLGYRDAAAISATLAQAWATQGAGEVTAGQGYSAKKYATDAAASAAAALASANNASAGQINADWNQVDPAQKSFIQNKPAVPTKTSLGLDNVDNTSDANKPVSTAQAAALNLKANTASLAAVATSGLKADVGLANVDNTSDANKPVSTAQQAALDLKATIVYVDGKVAALVNSSPAALDTLSELATALGNDANFATSTATALGNRVRVDAAQGLTAPQQTQGRSNLGLGNVDNTSDVNKPVSTAQSAAIAAVTKTSIGLGNVDNTSDVNKPVSTAQAAADALKLSLAGGTMTGDVIGGDHKISQMMLQDIGIVAIDKGNSGTALVTFDYTAGGYQKITATGAHTFAFSNWPPSGNVGYMQVEFVNYGAFVITPPTVIWTNPNGTETTDLVAHLAALAAVGGRSGFTAAGLTKAIFWCKDAVNVYGKFI